MRTCHQCGKTILFDTSTCPYCGHLLGSPVAFSSDEFLVNGSTLVKYIGTDEKVKVPFGIKSIGDNAFEDCDDVLTIWLPDSVETISENAFSGCFDLRILTIPNSVTFIGKGAFEDCVGLKQVRFEGNIEKWNRMVPFDQSTSNFTVVTKDLVEDFAVQFGDYFDLWMIPVNVTGWGDCRWLLVDAENMLKYLGATVSQPYEFYITSTGDIAICTDLSSNNSINQTCLLNGIGSEYGDVSIIRWNKRETETPVLSLMSDNLFNGYSLSKRDRFESLDFETLVRVLLGQYFPYIEAAREEILNKCIRLM